MKTTIYKGKKVQYQIINYDDCTEYHLYAADKVETVTKGFHRGALLGVVIRERGQEL